MFLLLFQPGKRNSSSCPLISNQLKKTIPYLNLQRITSFLKNQSQTSLIYVSQYIFTPNLPTFEITGELFETFLPGARRAEQLQPTFPSRLADFAGEMNSRI